MQAQAPILLLLVVSLLGGLCTEPARAQASPASWSDYRLGQFISSRGRTPADILALDNNGDILIACRDGCTRASLGAAGVPALASQLELLRGWSLLSEDENGLRAAIPIVDTAGAELLATRGGELANALAGRIAPDIAELVAALEAGGRKEHAYAVLFSYVLDGEVWSFFDELSLLPRRNVSRGGAPWGGEAWVYPAARAREPRTSSIQRESMTVKLTWVEALRPHAVALLNGPLSLRTLFADFLEKGKRASPELRARLTEYGILGADDALTVPLIGPGEDDALRKITDRMVVTVAESVAAELDRAALVDELGLDSEAQALVIAYHEVMWDLMERLAESGAVELPKAIAEPAGARPADVGALVVMARRIAETPPAEVQDRDQ